MTQEDLKVKMLHLEKQQMEEGAMLKSQFLLAYNRLKPVNILHHALQEIAESNVLKKDVINTALGLGVGYLSQKMFVNVSHNPVRRLLGTVLMFGVTNVVSNHPEAVKSIGLNLVRIIRQKLSGKSQPPEPDEDWLQDESPTVVVSARDGIAAPGGRR